MTELSRDEIRNHAVGCRLTPIPNTNPIVVQGLWTDLERFATAIYEAGAKSERAVSDRLLDALKLAYNQYMGCGGSLSPNEVVLAMQLVIGNALAEVAAIRKEK